jgi:hypothetical protein
MEKFYRFLAFVFVASFGVVSFFLVIFQQDIREYLSSINNLDVREPLVLRPAPTTFDPAKNPLSIDFLQNEKYRSLIKNEVDMTGLKLPGQATTTSTSTPAVAPEKVPEFKVGNPSPFRTF